MWTPDPDPFAVPAPTHSVAAAARRSRVVLAVDVRSTAVRPWAGGPVLEVEAGDATGELLLAFMGGRAAIGGVEPGRAIVVAGTVGRRDGRAVILNPYLWLPASADGLGPKGGDGRG